MPNDAGRSRRCQEPGSGEEDSLSCQPPLSTSYIPSDVHQARLPSRSPKMLIKFNAVSRSASRLYARDAFDDFNPSPPKFW
jgi:hypothetical protein